MNLYYSQICRKLGLAKTTDWGIAIRNASNFEGILSDKKNKIPFNVIPNTGEFWFADPIIFEDRKNAWMFVEAYNYQRQKGEIGVFDVRENMLVNFRTIITTPTHMSYPFVFKHKKCFYMIPETGAANEVVLYKAESFPDKWKREKVILSEGVFRDTTLYQVTEDEYIMMTYRQVGKKCYNVKYYLTLFRFNMKDYSLTEIDIMMDKNKCNRPAGPIISSDGELYRIAQKCDRAYGESIYIYKTSLDFNINSDKKVYEFRGQNIVLNDGRKPILVHTYSRGGGIEVIDFRCLKS